MMAGSRGTPIIAAPPEPPHSYSVSKSPKYKPVYERAESVPPSQSADDVILAFAVGSMF